VSEKVKILKKFEVVRYFRDVESWEIRKYSDGQIVLGVGGELYNLEGVENLVSGALDALHLMRKFQKEEHLTGTPAGKEESE